MRHLRDRRPDRGALHNLGAAGRAIVSALPAHDHRRDRVVVGPDGKAAAVPQAPEAPLSSRHGVDRAERAVRGEEAGRRRSGSPDPGAAPLLAAAAGAGRRPLRRPSSFRPRPGGAASSLPGGRVGAPGARPA